MTSLLLVQKHFNESGRLSDILEILKSDVEIESLIDNLHFQKQALALKTKLVDQLLQISSEREAPTIRSKQFSLLPFPQL